MCAISCRGLYLPQGGIVRTDSFDLHLTDGVELLLCDAKAPAKTAEIMKARYVYIMMGDSMILSEPDDTHMTLFNPNDELLELVKLIASGEGFFVWRGDEQ